MFRCKPRLLTDQGGATAIEFSILAPVFFAFILAIVDICAYFFVAGQLQYGVVQAARHIRTGQLIGTGPVTRDAFRTLVCNNISTIMIGSCTTNVRVDVRPSNTVSVFATLPPTLDTNGNSVIEDSETMVDTGGSGCPVIARAFYNYSTIVPGLQYILASLVPNNIYISAATAFRNEPFIGGTTTAC